MKFQYFFDLATKPDEMQILTVSAGGEMVRERLAPFFQAYKYYKLGNVKVSLVPASTLPVDPLGLSYDDDQTVDPRDQLTPGLTRITNGEDILENLNGLSAEEQHRLYNMMMLDTRWFKFPLQRGLKRSAVPLYWQIGQFHQDVYPGAITNVPNADIYEKISEVVATSVLAKYIDDDKVKENLVREFSSPYGFFQTGHKGRLGWLPTDALVKADFAGSAEDPEPPSFLINTPADNPIACIELFKIILPPAYRTKYYYRCYVTETVYFKSPVVNNLAYADDEAGYSYASLDRFIRARMPLPAMPTDNIKLDKFVPQPPNDGSSMFGSGFVPPGPDPPGPDPPHPTTDEFPTDPVKGQIFIPNWVDEWDPRQRDQIPVKLPDGWQWCESLDGNDHFWMYIGNLGEIREISIDYYGSHKFGCLSPVGCEAEPIDCWGEFSSDYVDECYKEWNGYLASQGYTVDGVVRLDLNTKLVVVPQ